MNTVLWVIVALIGYSIIFIILSIISLKRHRAELNELNEKINKLLFITKEHELVILGQKTQIDYWKNKYFESDEYRTAGEKQWLQIKDEVSVKDVIRLDKLPKNFGANHISEILNAQYRKFGKEVLLRWGRVDVFEENGNAWIQLTLHNEIYEGKIKDSKGESFSKKDVYDSSGIALAIRKLADKQAV